MFSADFSVEDLIKNYIYDCDGDPNLSYEAFVGQETSRKVPKEITRFICSPAWATRIQGKTTFKTKILCCYDDEVKGWCIRLNCPFFHPTRVEHMDPSFSHDPYECAPCQHSSQPGGCTVHSARLADATKWRVPVIDYRHEEPDPKTLDVEGVEVSFGPCGGQWKHWYDGEDPTVLNDWEHGEFVPHHMCRRLDESDRELADLIRTQVSEFLFPVE